MKNHSNKMLEPLVTFLCGVGAAVALMIFFYSSNALTQSCVQQINSSTNNAPPLQIRSQFNLSRDVVKPTTKETNIIDKELSELLQRAAMDDKTVIVTEINGAWSEPNALFDLFLESFRIGIQIEYLLNHMIILTTDEKAFDKCKSLHMYCYSYKVDGVDLTTEKKYKTKDFLKMMWARNLLQRSILEMGYNLLFTDADVMWFRNPFQYISVLPQITISSDRYYGDPDDLVKNDANTGFMYVKPTNGTIAFYKDWYAGRLRDASNQDQEVYQKLQSELSAKHQVRIRILDTSYMGGLCQPKIDFKKLCTFHATCRVGIVSKTTEMRKILNQWKMFKEKNLNLSTNAGQI